jgi:hypothetical protein
MVEEWTNIYTSTLTFLNYGQWDFFQCYDVSRQVIIHKEI